MTLKTITNSQYNKLLDQEINHNFIVFTNDQNPALINMACKTTVVYNRKFEIGIDGNKHFIKTLVEAEHTKFDVLKNKTVNLGFSEKISIVEFKDEIEKSLYFTELTESNIIKSFGSLERFLLFYEKLKDEYNKGLLPTEDLTIFFNMKNHLHNLACYNEYRLEGQNCLKEDFQGYNMEFKDLEKSLSMLEMTAQDEKLSLLEQLKDVYSLKNIDSLDE